MTSANQSPHWGYLLLGKLVVSYANKKAGVITGGDRSYWPHGHSVRVIDAAEVILFSPQNEHNKVIDHMLSVMAAPA